MNHYRSSATCSLLLLAICLGTALLAVFNGPACAQSASPSPGLYTLSGQAFAGRFSDVAWALPSLKVELHCSNSPDELGEQAASCPTTADGGFDLVVARTCEFYSLLVTDLQPLTAFIADRVGGKVINPNWIQNAHPLQGKVLSTNIFWMAPKGEVAATATPTHTPTPMSATTPMAPQPTPGKAPDAARCQPGLGCPFRHG